MPNSCVNKNIIDRTFVLFAATIILSALITQAMVLFGSDNPLLLEGKLFNDVYVVFALSAVFFTIQTGVITSVSLGVYKVSVFVVTLLYAAAIQPLTVHTNIPIMLYTTLIPTVVIFVFGIINKQFKRTLVRYLLVNTSIMGFQFLTLLVRNGAFYLGINVTECLPWLSIHLDQTIFMFAIYLKGGLTDDTRWRSFKLVVLQRDGHGQHKRNENDQQNHADTRAYVNAKGLEWVVSRTIKIGAQVLQLGVIALGCAVLGLLREGIVIALSFAVYGVIIVYRWHPKGTGWKISAKCAGASLLFFATLAFWLPPFEISKFLLILAGLAICLATNRFKKHQDMFQYAMATVDRVNAFRLEPFCDYERMKEIAIEKGLSRRQIEMLEWRYCKKANWAQLETKFGPWSQSSIRKYIKEAEDKFNS